MNTAAAKLRITGGKGLGLTFANGITISIQIGRGNYSDNYDFHGETRELPSSKTAEIAVWDKDGNWLDDIDSCGVKGYVPVEEVFRFAEWLRSLPSDLTAGEISIAYRAFEWLA